MPDPQTPVQRQRGAPGRRRRWFAALTLATLAPLGCHATSKVIAVPISSWPGYEYLGLVASFGVDRRHGLTLDVVQYPDPQAIVHAYLRGDQPVAPLTTVEAVDLCERVPERCPVVVLVLDESRGADQLAVRNDVPSLKDLRGRTIAVTFSTLGPYVVDRALDQLGMEIPDVNLRNMPLDRMASALASGEVAAAAFFPPYSERAVQDARSRVMFTSREIPGEIFDVLVVDPAYLRSHATEVMLLLRSWQEAHDIAVRQPERARRLMAQREQTSVAAFTASEQGLVYFPLAEQKAMLRPDGLIARNLERVQAVQHHIGLSHTGAPRPPVTDRLVTLALQQK